MTNTTIKTETVLKENQLQIRRLGIDTSHEAVIYMRKDCHVCRSEGFDAHNRLEIRSDTKSVIATLCVVTGNFLAHGEIGLSDATMTLLGEAEGTLISVHHAPPVDSLSHLRSKIYGHPLDNDAMHAIIRDINRGRYSAIDLSAFIAAVAGKNLNRREMIALTSAMIDIGDRLDWGTSTIVDKHCVGGLPGNRTTPIIVAIVTSMGLKMPKTSSRAITSPAGTADMMEMLAPVSLDLQDMRRVVEDVGGCIVWGGSVGLSPADDVLIRVERALDIDSEGQLVASVLSKKAAAGATHLVLDIPTGPTAKVRSEHSAHVIRGHLMAVAKEIGIKTQTLITDGSQPVGRGIGPALEAHDVLSVLQCKDEAPHDLRDRSILLAGSLLELASCVTQGQGAQAAKQVLESGQAWIKFQQICEAQGGMRTPPNAPHTKPIFSNIPGYLETINNRVLARIAKLAGAPAAPAAGVVIHKRLGDRVEVDEPLYTVHAETPGELDYAFEFLQDHPNVMQVNGG